MIVIQLDFIRVFLARDALGDSQRPFSCTVSLGVSWANSGRFETVFSCEGVELTRGPLSHATVSWEFSILRYGFHFCYR